MHNPSSAPNHAFYRSHPHLHNGPKSMDTLDNPVAPAIEVWVLDLTFRVGCHIGNRCRNSLPHGNRRRKSWHETFQLRIVKNDGMLLYRPGDSPSCHRTGFRPAARWGQRPAIQGDHLPAPLRRQLHNRTADHSRSADTQRSHCQPSISKIHL